MSGNEVGSRDRATRPRSRPPRVPAVLVAVLALVAAAFAVVLGAGPAGSPEPPACVPPETPEASAAPLTRDPAYGEPVGVHIPAIEVDALVRAVSTDAEGVLDPPASLAEVGWWSGGALAGSARGTVLLTGHTYHGDDGVFGRLSDLEPSDMIRVRTPKGVVRYRVEMVGDYSHEEFAAAAEELLDARARARLVLVTCSRYHLGHYGGNAVVVARMVARPATG